MMVQFHRCIRVQAAAGSVPSSRRVAAKSVTTAYVASGVASPAAFSFYQFYTFLIITILVCSCIQLQSVSVLASSSAKSSPPTSSSSPSTSTNTATTGSSSPASPPAILFVSISLRGHLVPLTRLASELTSRGHRVNFAVQEDGREYVNKTGAKFLSLGRLPYAKADRREKLKQICHDNSFFRGFLTLMNEIYLPNAASMYKSLHTIVARDRPSLIVMDITSLAALDIAHQFNIPYIINHPTLPIRMEHEPHYLSAFHTGVKASSTMSWLERSMNFLYPRLLAVALTPSLMDVNRLRWTHELPLFHSTAHIFEAIPTAVDTKSSSEDDEASEAKLRAHSVFLPHTASDSETVETAIPAPSYSNCHSQTRGPEVTLVNTAFGLEHAYPLPQNVILTGPLLPPALYPTPTSSAFSSSASSSTANATVDEQLEDEDEVHSSSKNELSSSFTPSLLSPPVAPSLQTWLDKSSKPVILALFGAGTMSYLDSWQVKALAAGLTDSRFRVIWSLRTDGKNLLGGGSGSSNNLPNSFRIKNNFPQLSVIAHKQVRLVLSPCGSGTVHESLYYGKPLLCIPLFADQLELASRVVETGVGLQLEKWHLEVGEISKAVLGLVRNQTYRASAQRMGKILRSSGGTKMAADIVERVLHQLNTKALVQPEQLNCWHQVYQLDLIACGIAVVILCLLLVRCTCMFLVAVYHAVVHPQANAGKIEWKQVDGIERAIQFVAQLIQPFIKVSAATVASTDSAAAAVASSTDSASLGGSDSRSRSDSVDSQTSDGGSEPEQQLRQRVSTN